MQRYRIIVDGVQAGEVMADSEAEALEHAAHERVFGDQPVTVDVDPEQPAAIA